MSEQNQALTIDDGDTTETELKAAELEAVTDALAGTWVGGEDEEFGRELTRAEAAEMARSVLKALEPLVARRVQVSFDDGWLAAESRIAAHAE